MPWSARAELVNSPGWHPSLDDAGPALPLFGDPVPFATVSHPGVRCVGCGQTPLRGARRRCLLCLDADFCPSCARDHDHDVFITLERPAHPAWGHQTLSLLTALPAMLHASDDPTSSFPSPESRPRVPAGLAAPPPSDLDARLRAFLSAGAEALARDERFRFDPGDVHPAAALEASARLRRRRHAASARARLRARAANDARSRGELDPFRHELVLVRGGIQLGTPTFGTSPLGTPQFGTPAFGAGREGDAYAVYRPRATGGAMCLTSEDGVALAVAQMFASPAETYPDEGDDSEEGEGEAVVGALASDVDISSPEARAERRERRRGVGVAFASDADLAGQMIRTDTSTTDSGREPSRGPPGRYRAVFEPNAREVRFAFTNPNPAGSIRVSLRACGPSDDGRDDATLWEGEIAPLHSVDVAADEASGRAFRLETLGSPRGARDAAPESSRAARVAVRQDVSETSDVGVVAGSRLRVVVEPMFDWPAAFPERASWRATYAFLARADRARGHQNAGLFGDSLDRFRFGPRDAPPSAGFEPTTGSSDGDGDGDGDGDAEEDRAVAAARDARALDAEVAWISLGRRVVAPRTRTQTQTQTQTLRPSSGPFAGPRVEPLVLDVAAVATNAENTEDESSHTRTRAFRVPAPSRRRLRRRAEALLSAAESTANARTHAETLARARFSDTCVICLESDPKPDCVLIPCGHACCHANEAGKLRKCPLCRSRVTTRLRVGGAGGKPTIVRPEEETVEGESEWDVDLGMMYLPTETRRDRRAGGRGLFFAAQA